jgi:hypothetical protein
MLRQLWGGGSPHVVSPVPLLLVQGLGDAEGRRGEMEIEVREGVEKAKRQRTN